MTVDDILRRRDEPVIEFRGDDLAAFLAMGGASENVLLEDRDFFFDERPDYTPFEYPHPLRP